MESFVIEILYLVPAILLALSVHEFSHGWVSYKLGDPTPLHEGRLSLNPFRHLDPMGTLFLIVFKFGWAKPVMVNPQYYQKPRRDMALVAAAGPLSNFILALLAYILIAILLKTGQPVQTPGFWSAFYQFLMILALINIGLGIFNLLPLPPLDGSKILGAFLPKEMYFGYMRFEQYGMMVLIILLFTGLLTGPLRVLREGITSGIWQIANFLTGFLGGPIF